MLNKAVVCEKERKKKSARESCIICEKEETTRTFRSVQIGISN